MLPLLYFLSALFPALSVPLLLQLSPEVSDAVKSAGAVARANGDVTTLLWAVVGVLALVVVFLFYRYDRTAGLVATVTNLSEKQVLITKVFDEFLALSSKMGELLIEQRGIRVEREVILERIKKIEHERQDMQDLIANIRTEIAVLKRSPAPKK